MKTLATWMALLVMGVTGTQAQSLLVVGRDPIPPEVESSYLKGLKYLVGSQKADGSWGDTYGQEPGVVGLAVMAMLAHGDDPNTGPYKDAIRRGIRYILSKANAKTGQMGGNMQTMYSHGFATLALAEAYGAVDEPLIGPVLQRAVDFLVATQKRNPFGAWRYSADSQDADTTVSGAQMVGLLAARNAGLNVPDEAIEKGLKFYRNCQDNSGGIGYTGPGGPNNTRTAIGLVVYTLARQKGTPFYKSAGSYFKTTLDQQQAQHPFYHEYYAAQAAFHLDETTWQAWNGANIKRMTRVQGADGSWGSGGFGPCYSTASALLSMALNYRYLPVYER